MFISSQLMSYVLSFQKKEVLITELRFFKLRRVACQVGYVFVTNTKQERKEGHDVRDQQRDERDMIAVCILL